MEFHKWYLEPSGMKSVSLHFNSPSGITLENNYKTLTKFALYTYCIES